MTEIDERLAPSVLPWVQFRVDMLTSREARRKAAIGARRRFVERNPVLARLPKRKAIIEARLALREDLVSARFDFRRAVIRNLGQLAGGS